MTFYNVISGILFLGACQAFLRTLTGESVAPTGLAATLLAVMCNEAVLTSEMLEERKLPYKLQMKLWDLLTFAVLSSALIVLSADKNVFDINVSARVPTASGRTLFFGLLAVYWVLTATWNDLAGIKSDNWKPGAGQWTYRFGRFGFPTLFGVAAVASWFFPDARMLAMLPWVLSVLVLTFMVSKVWLMKPVSTASTARMGV
jgi:hypothetical protein